jgi:hypothetical protein
VGLSVIDVGRRASASAFQMLHPPLPPLPLQAGAIGAFAAKAAVGPTVASAAIASTAATRRRALFFRCIDVTSLRREPFAITAPRSEEALTAP